MRRLAFCIALLIAMSAPARADDPVIITAADYWTGGVTLRQKAQNLAYIDFMARHPDVQIRSALPGLNIEGPAAAGTQLMQFVGGTSPDLIFVYLSNLRAYVEEGFLAPLDDAVGFDRNNNGVIDRDEIVWDQWWGYPAGMRAAATFRGHIYAIPDNIYHMTGLCYRRDLFAAAGLDPNRPPRSFDEFFEYAQRLTHRGVNGAPAAVGLLLDLYPAGIWHEGLWNAGGELVMQSKTTSTGNEVLFPLDQEKAIDPRSGEDLTLKEPSYRATFDSEQGHRIGDFLHRLRWQRWVRAPSGAIVNLDDAQRQAIEKAGTLDFADPTGGKTFHVTSADVYVGVVRLSNETDRTADSPLPRPFLSGEVAMLITPFNMAVFTQSSLPRSSVGFAASPTPTGQPGFLQSHSQFKALFRDVTKDPRKYRAAQDVLVHRMSHEMELGAARMLVEAGDFSDLAPPLLRRAGFDDLVAQIDPAVVKLYDDLLPRLRPEPYNRGWQRGMDLLRAEVFDTMFFDEHYDWRAGLSRAARTLNTQVFVDPGALVAPQRRIGWGVVIAVGAIVVALMVKIVRAQSRSVATTPMPAGAARVNDRWSHSRVMPWLLLLPSLLLIALWGYYPLARGSVMAFQRVHLFRPDSWVGVDNFLLIFSDARFYQYLWNTVVFAVITLGIGFVSPLFLALFLSEVPRGKYLFRTIFYLPSVTSGLVIMILWKEMYDPSSQGLLNQMLGAFGVAPQAWLHDPKWAMLCVILPGVWAGAGAGSLIYLAALKGIPDDLYEAAEVDGATLGRRLWSITLPMLKPLLIINFVGAFVGAFQGMGAILVMTGGGPADATRVLALDIWIKSFAELQFGLGTAMAWILASGLIGFTVLQLRILSKVDFRRAEGL